MLKKFPRHCNPYGISMFARGWPRDKFVHACNMLAQMLDNDQDGCADDIRVVKYMRLNQSGMAMFENENKEDYDLVPRTFNAQGLWASETQMGCSGDGERRNCRDAALEEILHVITAMGVSPAYPHTYGECYSGNESNLSVLQQEMDVARGGHFKKVPKKYPNNAIYHYYDKTCNYECQVTEFIYWVVTSYLNGQNARKNGNMEEWEASTKSDLQQKLPALYNLMEGGGGETSMVLFSSNGVLPGAGGNGAAATYNPTSQTCDGGCALDGTGCGVLGNKRDADPCDDNGGIDEPTASPVSQPSKPTGSPVKAPSGDNCIDSQLEMVVNRKGMTNPCEWLDTRTPKQKKKLCRKGKFKSHCPYTCDVCGEFGCSDSIMKFIDDNDIPRKCAWVENRPQSRCDMPQVDTTCRDTCGYCDQ